MSLLALLATFGSGCDRIDPQDEAFAVRDSAGVRIVENRAALWDPADSWRLSDAPEVEIGLTEGEAPYLFSRIAGALRLDDGRIVVADGQSNQLRFFDSAGRFLQAVGRSGAGPGEYEYLRGIGRCGGDSVFGFDLHWQAKVYSSSGSLVREMPVRVPSSVGTPYTLECSRAGHYVAIGWGEQPLQPIIGLYRATAPAYVLNATGTVVATLGEFLSSERIGSPYGSRPHPFGRSGSLTSGPDRVFIGTGEALEIEVYDTSGRLVERVRAPTGNLEIREEDLETYRLQRLEGVPPGQRPAVERELLDMPVPERFPAYDRLELDGNGNLWVRRFRRPGDVASNWYVFSPDRQMLGEVVVPGDLEVTEIGSDYVLGTARDDLGVERVRLYRLLKPAAR